MIAVAFRPIDPTHPLAVIFNTLTFWFFILMVMYFAWRIFFGRISSNKEKSKEEFTKLKREWLENGTAIADWVRTHLQELNLNLEATISNPEFQELLRKDFEIYEKLVTLDPKLKEDPTVIKGRDFYKFLIREGN